MRSLIGTRCCCACADEPSSPKGIAAMPMMAATSLTVRMFAPRLMASPDAAIGHYAAFAQLVHSPFRQLHMVPSGGSEPETPRLQGVGGTFILATLRPPSSVGR